MSGGEVFQERLSGFVFNYGGLIYKGVGMGQFGLEGFLKLSIIVFGFVSVMLTIKKAPFSLKSEKGQRNYK